MHYLGICAIIKDEDPFLDEWIAYYMHLGVEAFYLYDNGSEIPLRQSLAKFAALEGMARIMIYDARGRAQQLPAYNHCVKAHKDECRWIAALDIDEFVVPRNHDTIPGLLEEFEPYAGLAVNWKVFGSNGKNTRPKGLQIENYTKALAADNKLHTLLKCIVNPRSVKFFFNPHMFVPNPGERVVAEDGLPVTVAERFNVSWEKAQINHYYYRSKQDYHVKTRKRRASTGKERVNHFPFEVGEMDDFSALRFAPGVKKILSGLQ